MVARYSNGFVPIVKKYQRVQQHSAHGYRATAQKANGTGLSNGQKTIKESMKREAKMSKELRIIGGVGLTGLLTMFFIELKLTGHIDWSWWWVLSPSWIFVLMVLAIFLSAIIFVAAFKEWMK